MKILSLFSGIGAFEKALTNIGIDYELVGFSEIDKYAAKSYCAIHNVNESLNLGDITKIEKEKLPRFIDMITHGSPCQDFSIAGKQAGGNKGTETRSSLMWNTVDIVEWCLPKYVIWENVKNLLSKKHKHNFDSYIEIMDKLGYNSYYQVLNAKDYGIPQNRERVYTISIRKDIDKGDLVFPEKEELKLRLKDILEDEVDEKYYLSESSIKNLQRTFGSKAKEVNKNGVCDTLQAAMGNGGGNVPVLRIGGIFDTEKSKHQAGSIYDKEGLSPTLDAMQGGWRQPSIIINNATKKGYDEAKEGDAVNLSYPNSKTRRGRVGHQVSQTLQCNDSMGVVTNSEIKVIGNYMPSEHDASRIVDSEGLAPTVKENHGTVTATNQNLRIRKLTPKECWRLMRV